MIWSLYFSVLLVRHVRLDPGDDTGLDYRAVECLQNQVLILVYYLITFFTTVIFHSRNIRQKTD